MVIVLMLLQRVQRKPARQSEMIIIIIILWKTVVYEQFTTATQLHIEALISMQINSLHTLMLVWI